MIKLVTNQGCVLVYRYTKERNINELRHNFMYGYKNNRNSPVYRYTRTAPKSVFSAGLRVRCKALGPKPDRTEPQMLK